LKLDFFLFADGASAADGKVYIHGGAITKVNPPAYPSPPMMLSAVARMLVSRDDIGMHTVALEVKKPGSSAWTRLLGTEAEVPEDVRTASDDAGLLLIANLVLSFQVPGSHEFRLVVDDDELAARRLLLTPLDDPSRQKPE
jgi:hypothetical protein